MRLLVFLTLLIIALGLVGWGVIDDSDPAFAVGLGIWIFGLGLVGGWWT